MEEHYTETLVDLQDLLPKIINLDSVAIQHLVTQVHKQVLDTELRRLNYC